MAQALGTIYKLTLECVSPVTDPATLISMEREKFTTDDGAPTVITVEKEVSTAGGGLHPGSAAPGDRYLVTITSPDASPAVDDSSDAINDIVTLAGHEVNTQLGELTYYR
jgi:hypothetical protein